MNAYYPDFRYEILYTRKGYGQEIFVQHIIADCQSKALIIFVNAYFIRNQVFQIIDIDLSQESFNKQFKTIEKKDKTAS